MARKMNSDENGCWKITGKSACQETECFDPAGRGADRQNISVGHDESPDKPQVKNSRPPQRVPPLPASEPANSPRVALRRGSTYRRIINHHWKTTNGQKCKATRGPLSRDPQRHLL